MKVPKKLYTTFFGCSEKDQNWWVNLKRETTIPPTNINSGIRGYCNRSDKGDRNQCICHQIDLISF